MKIKFLVLLVFLSLSYSCEAESFWTKIKEKLPWYKPEKPETLADKAQHFVAECKEKAGELIENVWTSPENVDLACRAKEVAAKTLDTAQSAAGMTKDAAIIAGQKGKEAAEHLGRLGKEVLSHAGEKLSDTAQVASETGKRAASYAAEHLGQMSKESIAQAGEKLYDSAKMATETGKQAASHLGQLGKEAATYAGEKLSDTVKAASETTKRAAGQMTETATKLSANAQAAINAIGTFAETVSGDLRGVVFNFANCSSEQNTTCKRCQKIKIGLLGIDDEVCITLTYLPEEYALTTSLDLGSANLYKSTYSLSNPPPICFVPAGFDKIANVCLIFTDISVDENTKQLHGCLSLKISIFYNSIDKSYTKNLGCFNLGP